MNKKVSVIFTALFIIMFMFLCVTVHSYESKNIAVSVGASTAIPFLGGYLGEFDVLDKNTGVLHDAKLGKQSIGYSVSVLYFLNKHIALGPVFSQDYFPYDKASGLNKEVKTNVQSVGLLTNTYILTGNSFYMYIPVMLGYSKTKSTIKFNETKEFSDDGFSFYAGIGIEKYINKDIAIYFETGYNYNRFKFEDTEYKIGKNANYISYTLGSRILF